MTDQPVHMTASGPPETVLDDEPAGAVAALEEALARPEAERRDAVAAGDDIPPGLEGYTRTPA